MARLTCKFGIIKFIPNSVKQEVINIGVILHCPSSSQKLYVKFLEYEPRIKNFVTEIQYAEFRAFRRVFNKYIKDTRSKNVDPFTGVQFSHENYLEFLQEKLKLPFIIALPQFIFSEDPNQSILDLYNTLVLEPDECRVKQKTLIKQVEERFFTEGLDRYLERDISVKGLPFDLHIEFGYKRNLGFDFMQPISLQESQRENYKEGVFWKDAINKLHYDPQYESSNFFAIVKPPKNASRIGFHDLIDQLKSINGTNVVDYNSKEFDNLLSNIKNKGIVLNK